MIQGGFMLLPPSKRDISQTLLSAYVYVPLLPFRATRIMLRKAAQMPYNVYFISSNLKKKEAI